MDTPWSLESFFVGVVFLAFEELFDCFFMRWRNFDFRWCDVRTGVAHESLRVDSNFGNDCYVAKYVQRYGWRQLGGPEGLKVYYTSGDRLAEKILSQQLAKVWG